MALIAPRRLGQLRPMAHSRLNGKRLRSPTLMPTRLARTPDGSCMRLLRWLLGDR